MQTLLTPITITGTAKYKKRLCRTDNYHKNSFTGTESVSSAHKHERQLI